MQWKKSRITQKQLTNSHYNENYHDHNAAYGMIDHFKEPFLPSFSPSPLHVINMKGYSNYQNEYVDKSPLKKPRKKVTCEEVI